MELIANRIFRSSVRCTTSAGVGGVVWLALPSLTSGKASAFASIDHLLLLMPLVAAPLALALLELLRGDSGASPSPFLRAAQWLQPVAAGLLVVSFSFPSGRVAGLLTLPWLAVALTVAASGVSDVVRRRPGRSRSASLVAATGFLAVGAVWLLLWRLGTGPRSFSPLMISLAAMHFHFNGFSTQVLIGATGRRLDGAPAWLRSLQRVVTISAIGGLLVLAAGKAASLPVARLLGVSAMTLALVGLSATMGAVAIASRSSLTRGLLLISAASGVAAAGMAAAFEAGEFGRREWISTETMVSVHGLLMALGFTLCGLSGLLRERVRVIDAG